jgi:hypothetical protein
VKFLSQNAEEMDLLMDSNSFEKSSEKEEGNFIVLVVVMTGAITGIGHNILLRHRVEMASKIAF